MAWSFNPFTGNLDLTGSSGAVVFEGEEETFDALPVGIGDPPVGSSYLVRTSTGVWLVNRRQAGIWIRRNNTGVRATDWEYGGDYPVNSVNGQTGNVSLTAADVGASATGHTHAADAITSGTFDNARVNFAAPSSIGSTTASSGVFTTLSAAPTSGSALTLTGGTVTASAPLINASQTWNNAAVTFTGLAATITNTASNAASLVSRFTVGSTNVFEVDARGFTTLRKVATTTDFVNVLIVRRGTTEVFAVRDDGAINATAFSAPAGGAGHSVVNADGFAVRSSGSFRISSDGAAFSPDVFLRRDAAGVFAQYNAANPQAYRLYSTFTSTTSFERLNIAAQTGGSFIIGTEKGSAGGTARNLEFQTDGVTRLTIFTDGNATFTNNMTANNVVGQANAVFLWSTRTRMYADADGRIRISNNAQNDFDRIQFGGTTSSFPALKRSSTALQVRLADDSAFAPFACAGLTLNGDLTASTRNIVTDTTTGTKIGTGTTQLLGFWNATPAAQPAAVADATDAASTQARLNDLLARLRTLGLIAT